MVNWAIIQAFRAQALKAKISAKSQQHQLELLNSPLSPRVIEILNEEVCTCIAPITPFTVHCVLF